MLIDYWCKRNFESDIKMFIAGTTRQDKGARNRKGRTTEVRRNFEYVCRVRETIARRKD